MPVGRRPGEPLYPEPVPGIGRLLTARRSRTAVVPRSAAILAAAGVLAVATAGGTAGAATGAAALPAVPGLVVLVGTAGLRWDDLSDQTSTLDALLSGAAVGSLVDRTVQLAACPVDGWLAVSAGRRSDAPRDTAGPDPGCRPPSVRPSGDGGPATVTDWAQYRTRAAGQPAGAVPGTFGEALVAAGRTSAAIGPGAAVALARANGTTEHVWPGLPGTTGGGIDPGGASSMLADQVSAALAGNPSVLVIDLGAVRDSPGADPKDPSQAPTRDEQIAALDDRVGVVLGALPENATLLFASLADSGAAAHLQVAAAVGPVAGGGTFPQGLLRSGSTRQDGLVVATDVQATLLHSLGLRPPAATQGSTIGSTEGSQSQAGRLQRLLDLDDAAQAVASVGLPFTVIASAVETVLVGLLALLAWRTRAARRLRRRVLDVLAALAVVGALLPAGTLLANLWPWWRADRPAMSLAIGSVTGALVLAGVALLGPWRRGVLGSAGVAGALTAVVLGVDVATGSQLSLATPFGGQPLVAGRYFGLSNPTFALFGTGAFVAALVLAQWLLQRGSRRAAVRAVAGIGAVATLVDVLPALGADVGGPPALIPGFALLALWIAGIPVTWRRVGMIGLAGAALLAVVCVLDWLRPADQRTHLGRFVQTVLDGGGPAVVQRKLEQNGQLLVSSPLTLLVPVLCVVVVWALARPVRWRLPVVDQLYAREPLLRKGFVALGVLLLLGLLANDSGVSIPPVAMMLGLPLLAAACARTVNAQDVELVSSGATSGLWQPPRRAPGRARGTGAGPG
jgi:hypothetical protein